MKAPPGAAALATFLRSAPSGQPGGNGRDIVKNFVPGHIQLCCTAGIFAIHMSSYVVGRGSAVVAVEGPQPGSTAVWLRRSG